MTESPSTTRQAFNCPHCHVYAKQDWFTPYADRIAINGGLPFQPNIKSTDVPMLADAWTQATAQQAYFTYFSRCHHCTRVAIWVAQRLVFPATTGLAIEPNPDLSVDIQSDFKEARDIAIASPRGAAALLRLAVQKLCSELGGTGKSIDADIKAMVIKGLSPMVQQALDAVRVIGNEQVHGGVMDLRDDLPTVVSLFELMNLIAEQLITTPKQVQAVYDKLPKEKRDAIAIRDAAAKSTP
ncbi:hypothetical protein DyAD56_21195 [Dyella sp. AD56]|uniref:DUF4145 domain-containing protein n=1 Tax=Dyella sp. AD56 TaxID=1528744 RepID=UPI000CAAD3C3|nr:DUF4145 domain-containing protein [Dyella sp. AD56]PMQ03242.1 hypothetical protein DyAD56_21195 [Dyella sp. AD56]